MSPAVVPGDSFRPRPGRTATLGQHTHANALRDLRLILAALRPDRADMFDDPDNGLALAPRIVRPLLRRAWRYRRPAALASVLRTCEGRWERRRNAGPGDAVSVRQVAPPEAA